MGCTNKKRELHSAQKKILSFYIVILLLSTILFTIVPSIGGDGETDADIATYELGDYEHNKTEFNDWLFAF